MKLVIAEKPSVAKSISDVIIGGSAVKNNGCFVGNGYIVGWCLGHLVELAQPDVYSEGWKKWSYESLPMIPGSWKYSIKRDTAAQFKVLKDLLHDERVDSVVCATDVG